MHTLTLGQPNRRSTRGLALLLGLLKAPKPLSDRQVRRRQEHGIVDGPAPRTKSNRRIRVEARRALRAMGAPLR